jgi:hypothetical protein
MRRIAMGCAAVMAIGLALAPWAAAQVAAEPPAPTPAATFSPDQQPTREQLARLFEVMRLRQQLQGYLKMLPGMIQEQMRTQFKDMAAKVPGGEALKPEQQEALEKILNRYMEKAINIFTIDEMIDDMSGLYQRHLSRADVDAFIAFYSSPAGQHLLDQQPVIMQEYMPIVMKRAQERTKSLTEELTAELDACMKGQAPAADKPSAQK